MNSQSVLHILIAYVFKIVVQDEAKNPQMTLLARKNKEDQTEIAPSEVMDKGKLVNELLKLDEDVLSVGIMFFDGRPLAFADRLTIVEREGDSQEKKARRYAEIVKLASDNGRSDVTSIVIREKEVKRILMLFSSRRLIVEAVMPLWNHSTVFFEGVQRFFSDHY